MPELNIREAAHEAAVNKSAVEAEILGLEAVANLLRSQLAELREDRDRWRNMAESSAYSLRLVADQRERKTWWRWAIGRKAVPNLGKPAPKVAPGRPRVGGSHARGV